jgi:hypothetical protein
MSGNILLYDIEKYPIYKIYVYDTINTELEINFYLSIDDMLIPYKISKHGIIYIQNIINSLDERSESESDSSLEENNYYSSDTSTTSSSSSCTDSYSSRNDMQEIKNYLLNLWNKVDITNETQNFCPKLKNESLPLWHSRVVLICDVHYFNPIIKITYLKIKNLKEDIYHS